MKTSMTKIRTFLLITLTIIGITFSFSLIQNYIQAQEDIASQSLEVSPPTQEIVLDPGKTSSIKAKVRNVSKSTLPIQVTIQDFTASGEEGQVALEDAPDSIKTWASLVPDTFSLAPGESREVTVNISVPSEAAGGRYGSITFAVVNDTKQANAASVAQQISSLFLLKISGDVTEAVNLSSFSAPRFSEFGPIDFALKFYNGGNVYTKTYGLVNVSNMFGQKVQDIVVTPTNILPGASRNVHATLKQKFLFGPYTATAIMYYGSRNEVINATTTFFVFPVRLVVVVAIILFFLFLFRKKLKKVLKVFLSK